MKYCFFLLLCLTNFGLRAQNSPNSSAQPGTEREFNQKLLKQMLESNDFDYGTRPPLPSNGVLEWILDQISQLLSKSLLVDYLWETFSVITVLIALYLLLRSGSFGVFRNDKIHEKLTFSSANNHIYEQDLDLLLQSVIEQQLYREAIRLLHLKLLRHLSDKNIIDWKLDKTNYQYLNEIKNPDISMQFRSLSNLYEYVWYGDFEVTEERFFEAKLEFDSAFDNSSAIKLNSNF